MKVKRYKNVKFNKDKIENLPKLKKEYNDNKEFPKRGNIINSEGALDKYLLSESQQTRFNELKAKNKLTFPERKEIKRLEGQIRFNELHNKLISEGKLSRELEKEYTSLQTMLEQILTKTNTKSIQKNSRTSYHSAVSSLFLWLISPAITTSDLLLQVPCLHRWWCISQSF